MKEPVMSMLKKISTWFVAMFAATALMVAYAADPVIEQAKAQGVVGEQYDGYLGIVDTSKASADLKRRVSETNAGRLAEYTRISQKTGDSVSIVAIAMAEKQFARAESGEMLKAGPNDPWKKQP
jgi:uncharacterized protein YdbL (DUF1318 family)